MKENFSSDEMGVLVSFYIWSSSVADYLVLQYKEHLQVFGVDRYFIMVSAEYKMAEICSVTF